MRGEIAVGAFLSRIQMTREWLGELRRTGAPTQTGNPRQGTVFLLDGVGGTLIPPVLARKALGQAGLPFATYLFDWHRGPRGEMLGDLMCKRRNQREALRLARLIRRYRRANPEAPLHVLAYSGGTGVAAFAIERLGLRTGIDTLILACPALSPGYPLDGVLERVRQCYVLVSSRDRWMLGLGTSLFGTIDRRFGRAAGLVGFDHSPNPRLREIRWTERMSTDGHFGHHTGWATTAFIRNWIAPLLTE